MGAAFENLAGNTDIRLERIEAADFGAAAWICRNAAGLSLVRLVTGRVPVAGPLPDISDHVVKAVSVRWEGGDGRRALITVLDAVLVGEFALPGVRHGASVRRELMAPGELGSVQATPCRE